jgi:hypothetical protein
MNFKIPLISLHTGPGQLDFSISAKKCVQRALIINMIQIVCFIYVVYQKLLFLSNNFNMGTLQFGLKQTT